MFFFLTHAEAVKKKILKLLFLLNFSFSTTPLAQETRHYPYPPYPATTMKEKEGHALQRLHKSHPTPPYPALGQGMVNLSPDCL
jgi:hypothetical protein